MAIQSFDEMRMLCDKDYVYEINDRIRIRKPTLREIAAMGEQRHYGMLSAFVSVPSDLIAELDEMGLDFTTISEWELFLLLVRNISKEDSVIWFEDGIDFQYDMNNLYLNKENGMTVLITNDGVTIDPNVYNKIAEYLRAVYDIQVKRERPRNKLTKRVMIQEAKSKLAYARRKPHKSQLRNMISTVVNSEGGKYNYEEILDLDIVAFTDSVKRLMAIASTKALMHGAYSGMVDLKKIPKDSFDMMRDLTPKVQDVAAMRKQFQQSGGSFEAPT